MADGGGHHAPDLDAAVTGRPMPPYLAPVVRRVSFPAGRRVLVVSDIHGHLEYLRGLLAKCAFSPADILVIDGDILEKGPEPLATLRYVMALARDYTVYTVCGNCDHWQDFCDRPSSPERDESYRRYLLGKNKGWGDGVIAQMLREQDIAVTEGMELEPARAILREAYREEFDFLRSLPHILETEDYIFVHGGYVPEKGAYVCMKRDEYRRWATVHKKWTVVGHWPVVLYREDITDANPIIDEDLRLISIDGGCVLKDDGQLNALILPSKTWISYDRFPEATVVQAQEESERHYYIRHGDNLVTVLRVEEEFSLCRHERTGYEMWIQNRDFLADKTEQRPDGRPPARWIPPQAGQQRYVNDCTDYRPALRPGDRISVVRRTSRGIQCKFKGISGWYDGQLE